MFIKVDYEVYSSYYSIYKKLQDLASYDVLSYDCETQSLYTVDERKEAAYLIKNHADEMEHEDLLHCKLAANSDGLSHPSITKVTHFIFGLSESSSVIIIANEDRTRKLLFNWIADFKGKLLIHNTMFDLKIVHHFTDRFPIDYEDTQLLAKMYMNDAENWKSNSGLKHLMGQYYDPAWSMIETYDIVDYKDEAFLRYCAIDGASTFKLWNDLQDYKETV